MSVLVITTSEGRSIHYQREAYTRHPQYEMDLGAAPSPSSPGGWTPLYQSSPNAQHVFDIAQGAPNFFDKVRLFTIHLR